MSRIIYPEDFVEQTKLQADIRAKHNNDGAGSPLTTFLTAQNIDLEADFTTGQNALAQNTESKTKYRESEKLNESRDLKFKPVMRHLRGSIQFLKAYYGPNISTLGDWGVTVDNDDRIVYPSDFPSRYLLFKDFKAKHDSFAPGESPLDLYLTQQEIDLNVLDTAADEADTDHDDFITNSNDAEEATAQRNVLWEPVWEHVHQIGNFLKALFSANAKKLGQWGFRIDHSPRKPRLRKSTVLPQQQRKVTGLVIGRKLRNTGPVPIDVYNGKVIAGIPLIVQPNEEIAMLKGYSRIIVDNTSATETATFTSWVHR